MSEIKDHRCVRCGAVLTTPSPIVAWAPGTSVNGGMTMEIRGGVGSAYEGFTLVGVICDPCVAAVSALSTSVPAGKLTAYYPQQVTLPVALVVDDGMALPPPPVEG